MVNRRSDTDLGNTQSAPRGGERATPRQQRRNARFLAPGGILPRQQRRHLRGLQRVRRDIGPASSDAKFARFSSAISGGILPRQQRRHLRGF